MYRRAKIEKKNPQGVLIIRNSTVTPNKDFIVKNLFLNFFMHFVRNFTISILQSEDKTIQFILLMHPIYQFYHNKILQNLNYLFIYLCHCLEFIHWHIAETETNFAPNTHSLTQSKTNILNWAFSRSLLDLFYKILIQIYCRPEIFQFTYCLDRCLFYKIKHIDKW